MHEGKQRSDLHGPVVNLESPKPHDPHDCDVEDEHGQREEKHEQRPNFPPHDHNVSVGIIESIFFDRFTHKRTDHSDSGELFTHDAVDGVEFALEAAEQRNHTGDNHDRDGEQHRDRNRNKPDNPTS